MSLWQRVGGLLCVALVLGAIAAQQLSLSYNLAEFLPPAQTAAERHLLRNLNSDQNSQTIFAQLPDAADPFEARAAVQEIDGLILQDTDQGVPELLLRYQLTLCPWPERPGAWAAVLSARYRDVATLPDADLLDLIAEDPRLCSTDILERLSPVRALPESVLVLTSDAAAFDGAAQSARIQALREHLPEGSMLFGSSVYAADLQATVRWETTLFSTLAGVMLAALILLRFRSLAITLAVAVPLLFGVAAAALVTALAFDSVHGITLAFGITVLGVAIDYPLHVFAHERGSGIWRTLSLGVLSSLIGYAAFLFGGAGAIVQLGVFAISGLIGAALAARALAPAARERSDSAPTTVRHWPWLAGLAFGIPAIILAPAASNDLSRLTPLPDTVLKRDAQLRQEIGATDIRYRLLLQDAALEPLLQKVEATSAALDELTDAAVLQGHRAVTQLLPSQHTQAERANTVRQAHFTQALAAEPRFAGQAFAPFSALLTRPVLPITLDELRGSPLAPLAEALLYREDDLWHAVIDLQGVQQPEPLRVLTHAELIDLKRTSEDLVARYRNELTHVLLWAGLVIIVLIALATRSAQRAIWCAGTLAATLTITAAASAAVNNGVSIFALMALLLVAGLGLDYVLFSSRGGNTDERQQSAGAVALCAVSSAIVFGVLWLSDVPVLQHIGSTVFIGVLMALMLARSGSAQRAAESREGR